MFANSPGKTGADEIILKAVIAAQPAQEIELKIRGHQPCDPSIKSGLKYSLRQASIVFKEGPECICKCTRQINGIEACWDRIISIPGTPKVGNERE